MDGRACALDGEAAMSNVRPSAYDGWIAIHNKYNWTVDLSDFRWSRNYPGYFDRIIKNPLELEDKLREAVNSSSSLATIGEVCFWKNYGNSQSRDTLTLRLLEHLQRCDNGNTFTRAVKELSYTPSWSKFIALQRACNQLSGFATPLTFLSFYNPLKFPMVDKHIAYWWAANKSVHGYDDAPVFSQIYDGWIQPIPQSWEAYDCWTDFCCYYAKSMKSCGVDWRARDIEMAVWEAQKRRISLQRLDRNL